MASPNLGQMTQVQPPTAIRNSAQPRESTTSASIPGQPDVADGSRVASACPSLVLVLSPERRKAGPFERWVINGSTVAELAVAAGIAPCYAREWMEQRAVAGVLVVDDVSAHAERRRYTVPEAHVGSPPIARSSVRPPRRWRWRLRWTTRPTEPTTALPVRLCGKPACDGS
jgi:hypothetical protein